ncbi:MAG TPA: DegT/DnrJ/EryC1/StrS family aminotransferase, partial [Gammaproteobacteria bacterium]|nr:DegT/DnrJ/EryC1/StrS family aminotransferase [Gammaproteobacteria bacterium]
VALSSCMRVPLLDLKSQYAPLRDQIEQAIREVCDAQQFVLGPRVAALEDRIALYSQSSHGIGVSSGTDALLLALMGLGVGAGDEVITTPYTFFATAGVVARLGARPVFCDIDEHTFNLDPDTVDAFIDEHCERTEDGLLNRRTGGRIKVLMPVHLYGQMADMPRLMAIAEQNGLAVIEDAAQAIGAELPYGRRAGSLGAVGCFSFFPTKNLGAFGDAGLCVSNDPELAERLKVLRVHGAEPKYYHSLIGGNFRLDELQAAVLLIKLGHLDAWTEARQGNAAHYRRLFDEAGLEGRVTPPSAAPGYRHIFNQYVIRAERRDELRAYLQRESIGTEIYYPVPLHAQQCFAYLGYRSGEFSESNRAAAETLALPVYPELEAEQRELVVDRIRRFYER